MKRKNEFRKNKLNLLTIITLFLIIIFCASYLINYKYNKTKDIKQLQKLQEEIQQEIEKNSSDKSNKEDKNNKQQDKKQILPEYQKFYNENNDMYGRIAIDGIEIEGIGKFDFPVMFTPENPNFYSDKNWKKEKCESAGTSVWIDGRTTEKTENIIVYGHNMKNLSMFGALKYYKERSFYENHKYIQFDTLYEKQIYEIIAVSEAVVYYNEEQRPKDEYLFYEHIELDSKKEFDTYVSNVKKHSWYNIEVTAKYGDQLITLCTCDYETKNARLIIVAKRI